ncbi:hypothetical protein [Cecembia sp.]|uniref:hypothetical protein n=1 Tax=Cecembia sp. TaxID=1898110 RepID=UPI0025BDF6F5|nr:hypothetical protein [Cecembia sp.]
MKKTAIGIILMFVLGASLYLFYLLGGFNEILVFKKDYGNIELVGIQYKGTPQNDLLRQSFLEMERLQKSHEGAVIHTIYQVEPAGKLDTLEVFIGIEKKFLFTAEKDKAILSLDASSAVVAEINANRWVMPGPKKVKTRIKDFAIKNQLPEPNLFIDQILGPESIRVIGIYQLDEE